jgi:hypothetical protein
MRHAAISFLLFSISDYNGTLNQRSSWPGLSRPSTSLRAETKTWMPGTRPGMTTEHVAGIKQQGEN